MAETSEIATRNIPVSDSTTRAISERAQEPRPVLDIVPAILVKSRKELVNRLKKVEKYAKRAQIDIIDGKFAPNKTISAKALKGVRTKLKLEIQLMVKNPKKHIKEFAKLKPWMIIFHIESCKSKKEALECIQMIKKAKIKPSIALNPDTSAAKIKPYLKLVDQVLVMTVYPGFMGKPFVPKTLGKIRTIRSWSKKPIEVDGGIHVGTAKRAAKAGATVFVAGSAIFGKKDIKKSIIALRKDVRFK